MDLNEVAIFIKVVQTGSFSETAKQMKMPKSTVSFKVSNLERTLGTTLIQRTTRKLNITAEGEAFYKRALGGIEEIYSAEAELSSLKGEPQGLLRITAPLDLGNSVLPQIIADYAKKYPKVTVDVLMTDRYVDMLGEKVDLAIRAGNLKDSTLLAKKLGVVYFAPFASPKYIKQHGKVDHPRDLTKHQMLHFPPAGQNEWRLSGPKGTLDIPVNSKLILNNLLMIKSMALMGEGIAFLPTYYGYQEVKAGKLVRLLPEWRSPLTNVHFVYPSQKFVKPKLKAFIEMASEPLKENFEDFEI
jgi:DNA-binding transcriptional LysR family regulator